MKPSKALSLISFLVLWACSGEAPNEYRGLVAPEDLLASSEARAAGAALFEQHCALCHGSRGDGRGERQMLSTPARDFTDPHWRTRVTPEDIFLTIREGRPRTPMAAWKFLSTEETWSLVAHILTLSESRE